MSLVTWEPKERELMKSYDPDSKLKLAIRDDLTDQEIIDGLEVLCNATYKVGYIGSAFRASLGRMLALASASQTFLETAGFESMGAYEEHLIGKTGLSRTVLKDAQKIHQHFPNLEIGRYGLIGHTKLLVCAKVTNQNENGCTEILRKAEKLTEKELVEWLHEKGYIDKDEHAGGSFSVKGSLAKIKEIRGMLKSAAFHHAAESDKEIDIILAALRSCKVEWIADYEQHVAESSEAVEA